MVGQWEMDPDGANYVPDVTVSETPTRKLAVFLFFFVNFPDDCYLVCRQPVQVRQQLQPTPTQLLLLQRQPDHTRRGWGGADI